jgi:hypothetical protein
MLLGPLKWVQPRLRLMSRVLAIGHGIRKAAPKVHCGGRERQALA